jgi:membrane associated rhomboid family serine protease
MFSERRYTYAKPPRQSRSMGGMIIWATVAVFFLQLLTQGQLTALLQLSAPEISRFQLWRIGSYMFAHGSLTHLFVNMWGLFLFGRMVEERLGGTRFLNLYFTSGFIGGLAWLLFNWKMPAAVGGYLLPAPAVVGASGALFGVMMAAAMMFPNQRIMLLLPPVEMPLKTFVPVYALIEILMLWRADNVAHLAHLGGLVGGFLYIRGQAPELWQWHFLRALRDRWRRRGWRKLAGGKPPPAGPDAAAPSSEEIDRILDKIGREGINRLTAAERRTLEHARERLRNR